MQYNNFHQLRIIGAYIRILSHFYEIILTDEPKASVSPPAAPGV